MKVLFFISAIFMNGNFTPTHDVAVAVFHITESNDILEIDITFDLDDFSESLGINTSELSLEYMQVYLNKNTSFQFNSQVANLKISEMQIVRDHIEVKGNFGGAMKSIKTIKVENTCLNNVPHHSNVIQIDLNNKSRDYRMHKKKNSYKHKILNLED